LTVFESTDDDTLGGGDPGFILGRDEAKAAADVVEAGIGRRLSSFEYRVAAHESGHITAGRLLGLPVAGSTINFIDGHFGLTWASDAALVDDGETVETICAVLTPLIGDDRSDIAAELQRAGHQVISLLAGPIAEDLFCGARLAGTEHDGIEARAIAGLICRSPTSVDAYLDFARAEASALLADHAASVLAIADALIRYHTIDAAQIDQIIVEFRGRQGRY
jgi:hypothetical protein